MKFLQKRRRASADSARDPVRQKDNGFCEVRIVSPKKGPTSVSLAEIRRAVRHPYDAQKGR